MPPKKKIISGEMPPEEPIIDGEMPPEETITCGLRNVGDSCYLNAALQLLFVFFGYKSVSIDPEPPLPLKEYFPPGFYDSLEEFFGFSLLTAKEMEPRLTLQSLNISRRALNELGPLTKSAAKVNPVPNEVRLPLVYLVTAIIREMINESEPTDDLISLLRALQFKLKALQPTVQGDSLTEDAPDIFFRLLECKNYLMKPTLQMKTQWVKKFVTVEKLDNAGLRLRLQRGLEHLPPDIRLWVESNLDSEHLGRDFVR